MADFDLVIRGGELHDGLGGVPVAADVAVSDGRIAAVAKVIGSGREEIDARGKIVTPGFVDIHTHYDGQATWEKSDVAVLEPRRHLGGDGQLWRWFRALPPNPAQHAG